MTADPEVLYEVADHIATITLSRPNRMNTISRAVPGADLADVARALAAEIAGNAPLAA